MAVSLKYDVPHQTVLRWKDAYEREGFNGLKDNRKRLKKKRERTQAELDELEVLRRRNEYLEKPVYARLGRSHPRTKA